MGSTVVEAGMQTAEAVVPAETAAAAACPDRAVAVHIVVVVVVDVEVEGREEIAVAVVADELAVRTEPPSSVGLTLEYA